MVSVAYTHRLICDCSFINWLLKQSDKNSTFTYLMHIKSSSEHWKKCHNLLLKSELKSGKDKLKMEEENIGAIFKIVDDPHFLSNYKEQVTKNIIFAIDASDERPFKCYFFTSPERESEYKTNRHYNGITSVEIVSGEKAKRIIKEFFLAFETERNLQRC